MKISFPRGDLFCFPFGVYIDGANTQTAMDKVWFTVKKHFRDKTVIIQKTLENGGIIDAGGGGLLMGRNFIINETIDVTDSFALERSNEYGKRI